jgi:hypothetical protein
MRRYLPPVPKYSRSFCKIKHSHLDVFELKYTVILRKIHDVDSSAHRILNDLLREQSELVREYQGKINPDILYNTCEKIRENILTPDLNGKYFPLLYKNNY